MSSMLWIVSGNKKTSVLTGRDVIWLHLIVKISIQQHNIHNIVAVNEHLNIRHKFEKT